MANSQGKATANPGRKKPRLPIKRKKQVERLHSNIDWFFAGILLVLLTIGTIFVYSASYVFAKQNYGSSYFFINKQLGWVMFSLAVLFAMIRYFDYLILKKFAYLGFFVSYILLISVYFIGEERNGAKRWLDLKLFDLQPSEIVKFTVILVIATYVVWLDNQGKDLIRTVKYGITPFAALAAAVGVPLLLQPHLSATIIVLLLIFFMMFMSGVKGSYLRNMIIVGLTLALIVILFTNHGQARIDAWLHPEKDTQGSGWQPLQSLYAIGSGGLWGVGFGASKQKHLYLPEPQNDYIFAIICEEMGFMFAIVVIILFLLLIWRGFRIAKNAPSKFSSLLVMGIISQIGIQVFLNIGVVSGALPSTGVSLPFFSYGGSSLVILMAEMGVVLNISKYSYSEKV